MIQGRYANGFGTEFATHFMLKFWRTGSSDFTEYRYDIMTMIILLKDEIGKYEQKHRWST